MGDLSNRNPYSDDQSGFNLFINEDKTIKEELLLKIKMTDERLSSEIEKMLPALIPKGDHSVYTGYCGVALLYLLKYQKRNDKRFLSKGLNLVESALSNLKGRRISFLNGDSGPLALAIVLNYFQSDKAPISEDNRLLKWLLSLDVENPSHPDEILYGRAGYLYSLFFVENYCGPTIPKAHLRKVIEFILRSGQRRAKDLRLDVPLSYEWHGKNYFGAAHGVAGILFLLLIAGHKFSLLRATELETMVRPTVNWLATQRYPTGNFMSSEGSNNDRLVQWCHGAPGFVDLFIAAYQVFGDKLYLNMAVEAGEIVWQRGLLTKGYSICHGASGNGYSFLALYKQTKEIKHLHRALCFAEWCTGHPRKEGMKPDRPYSLFEGIAGVDYFLCDIQDTEAAAFPAYSIP